MSRRLVAGAMLGIVSQLCSVGLLLTSAWLIVRAAEHPPILFLMVAIVSVRFFGLGRAVLHYGERLVTHNAALHMLAEERVRAYQELERAAPAGLHRQRRGDVVSRVVGDVEAVQDRLLRIDLPWVYAVVSSACVVAVLGAVDPLAGLIIAAHGVGCCLFVRLAVPRRGIDRAATVAELEGRMSAEASALALTGRDLVASGASRTFAIDIGQSIDRLAEIQSRRSWGGALRAAYILGSSGLAVALLTGPASASPRVLAGVVLLAPVALLEPLLQLADAERLRPGVVAARQRLDELRITQTPVAEPTSARPLPASSTITVDDLAIGWHSTLAQHISFRLGRGDLLGVAGASGVGKSTLALTLLRLVEPRSGCIRLGDVTFGELAGPDIRTRIGLAGHGDVLFDTTIRENLRIADPAATDRDLHAALARAGLGDFVLGLPLGLDTFVGEHGNALSGGERKRLAVARLLLGRHEILVFDEPTEHLDEPAAAALLADIQTLTADHGVMIVSHSSVALAACHSVIHLGDEGPPSVPEGPHSTALRVLA